MELHHTAVKEETGFSAVEMLLSLIAVSLITFVGYYVYHTQQATNAINKSITTAATAPVPRSIHKVPSATATAPAASGYYAIKEWGVKIKLAVADKVFFTVTNESGQAYDSKFESSAKPVFKPENLVDKTCSPGVELFRSMTKPTVSPDNPVKVGQYYYFANGAPGGCSNDADNKLKISFLDDFSKLDIQQL